MKIITHFLAYLLPLTLALNPVVIFAAVAPTPEPVPHCDILCGDPICTLPSETPTPSIAGIGDGKDAATYSPTPKTRCQDVQTAAKCAERSLYQQTHDWELATASVYTAAAAACAVAFAATFFPPANATLKGVCDGLAGIATALDITALIKISVDGGSFVEGLSKLGTTETAFAGVAPAALLIKSSTVAGKTIVRKITVGMAFSGVAAAMLTAVATLKWINMKASSSSADLACTAIEGLYSTALAPLPDPPKKVQDQVSPLSQTAIVPAGATSGGSSGTTATATNSIPTKEHPQTPQQAAALAKINSDIEKITGGVPPEKVLKAIGSDVATIAKKLETSSPGAVIASMLPNLPPDIVATLKQVDQLGKEGRLHMTGDVPTGVMKSSGKGRSGKSGPEEFNPFTFGFSDQSIGPKPGDVTFSPSPTPVPGADGDIWHSEWNGTIFQLISTKLKETRDRIDQIEWITPLNRALNGLKNQPTRGKP